MPVIRAKHWKGSDFNSPVFFVEIISCVSVEKIFHFITSAVVDMKLSLAEWCTGMLGCYS
jgi:hypothetical protein